MLAPRLYVAEEDTASLSGPILSSRDRALILASGSLYWFRNRTIAEFNLFLLYY
jgi:hypothetical protein